MCQAPSRVQKLKNWILECVRGDLLQKIGKPYPASKGRVNGIFYFLSLQNLFPCINSACAIVQPHSLEREACKDSE